MLSLGARMQIGNVVGLVTTPTGLTPAQFGDGRWRFG